MVSFVALENRTGYNFISFSYNRFLNWKEIFIHYRNNSLLLKNFFDVILITTKKNKKKEKPTIPFN